MQEVKKEDERTTIKYINPIIIGTLALSIWEIAIYKIVEKIGFWNLLYLSTVIIILISILIGIIKKEIEEDSELFYNFDEYSNKKRLQELLLYRILKTKK